MLTPEEVEVSQGRVWSGEAAKAQKLVDELGESKPFSMQLKAELALPDSNPNLFRKASSSASLTQWLNKTILTQIVEDLTPLTRDRIWAILPYYESSQ